MLEEVEYLRLAERELTALVNTLDELALDDLDCEFSEGILTLEFGDGSSYVINSHRAAGQIWMAAERTAWHFDWNGESQSWTAAKNGDELWEAVRRCLTAKLGKVVVLPRPAF